MTAEKNVAEGGTATSDPLRGLFVYRNYVVLIIAIGFALNFLDRQIIGILLQPIKEEFHVSDTALGFLSGLAFAIFYATLGIPLATVSDRKSRRVVLTASMVVWSAMTAVCGLAQNFWQLVLARFGVGVGEAGFTPAAFSVIADYFPKHLRARAVGLASIGTKLGAMMGLFIGGVALELVGWRGAMLIAGIPGIFFALLVWTTLKEPIRGMSDGIKQRAKEVEPVGMVKAAGSVWGIPSFRMISIGAGFSAFGLYGLSAWMPSLLMRTHEDMSAVQVGVTLGLVAGIAGGLGSFLSGFIADAFWKRDVRWSGWLPAIASFGAMIFYAVAFLVPDINHAIVLYAIGYFLAIFYGAPTSSILQSLLPVHMRATGTAWKLLMVNLIGLGFGPQFVGILSDVYNAAGFENSLHVALLTTAPVMLLPTILYVLAARSLPADIDAADKRNQEGAVVAAPSAS